MFVVVIVTAAAIAALIAAKANETSARRHDICVQIEGIKSIIRESHVLSLHNQLVLLHENPNGFPGEAREYLLNGIKDERSILRALAPIHCSP